MSVPSDTQSLGQPLTKRMNLEFPMGPDIIYLRSPSNLAYGSVQVLDWNIDRNDGVWGRGQEVKVEVEFRSHIQAVLDCAKVDLILENEGEVGIEILVGISLFCDH